MAITRTELQHENELLRIANADKTPTSAQSLNLHLGFLFSSPLILKVQSGNRDVYQQIPQLSYIAESKLIKAAAQQSGRHIRFLR